MMVNAPRSRRAGVTLVEILTAIAIIGILMAILIPAMQSARATARQTQCRNHLHQLALAIHNRVEASGTLSLRYNRGLVDLLPFVDQAALYSQMQTGTAVPSDIPGVAVFICPSDSQSHVAHATFNYLLNGGNRLALQETNGVAASLSSAVRPGDVTDGLSNTALMAERLFSMGLHQISTSLETAVREGSRYTWFLEAPVAPQPDAEKVFEEACRSARTTPFSTDLIGGSPLGLGFPPYTHILPPNSVGCFNAPAVNPFIPMMNSAHGVTATSHHPGGVHVAYCDGHVSFVSQGIDRRVWSAIGSINGNDLASTPSP